MTTPTAVAVAPVTFQSVPVTTGFQIVKAGSGQVNIYNGDIVNVLLVSRSPTPVLSNSLPVQPLTNATIDGTYAHYASAQSGTIAQVVVSSAAQLSPSPAQIAQQIQALGLATATNQVTQIGQGTTTNGYLGGTSPGALVSGAGRTVAGETAALLATGVVTGPPGGSPLLRFTNNLGKGSGTNLPNLSAVTLVNLAPINQPGYECEFTCHFSAGLGTSPFVELIFIWTDSGSGFVTKQLFFFIPGGSGVSNAITCYLNGPCYGNELSVTATNTDSTAGASLDNWTINQTSHVYVTDKIIQYAYTSVNNFTNPDGVPGTGVVCSTNPSIAAASSVTRLLAVYSGRVGVAMDNLGNANALRIRFTDPTSTLYSIANNNKDFFGTIVPATSGAYQEIPLPRGPVNLEMHNQGATGSISPAVTIVGIDY